MARPNLSINYPQSLKSTFLPANMYKLLDAELRITIINNIGAIERVSSRAEQEVAWLENSLNSDQERIMDFERQRVSLLSEYFLICFAYTNKEEEALNDEVKAVILFSVQEFVMSTIRKLPVSDLLQLDVFLELFKKFIGTDFSFWYPERIASTTLLLKAYLGTLSITIPELKDIPESELELADLIFDGVMTHMESRQYRDVFRQPGGALGMDSDETYDLRRWQEAAASYNMSIRHNKQLNQFNVFILNQLAEMARGMNLELLREMLSKHAVLVKLIGNSFNIRMKLSGLLKEWRNECPWLLDNLEDPDLTTIDDLILRPETVNDPLDALFALELQWCSEIQAPILDGKDQMEFDSDIVLGLFGRILKCHLQLLKIGFKQLRMDPKYKLFVNQKGNYKVKSADTLDWGKEDSMKRLGNLRNRVDKLKSSRTAAIKYLSVVYDFDRPAEDGDDKWDENMPYL